MGAFFIYVLKSAFCLIFFYLFFRLLLSKETFHRFNRFALLGVLCFSWIIPWIEVTTKQQIELSQIVLTVEQLLIMAENASIVTNIKGIEPEVVTISWIQVILLVYLIGILFFICRNIYSLFSLVRLLLSSKREFLDKGIVLVVHEKEIAPFSWMRYIVISRKDLEENGREILIHEMAHLQNRHSWDLLLADICIFFQWFNPGAWLLKQELQNIHEYEADETVINEGVNAKEYQLLLIKKAVGTRLYSMANSFNHSKLKKRITMMLKEKSNPWVRLKYLYVFPLAAVAMTAFARPEVSKTVEEISAVKVNDLAAIVETKVSKIAEETIHAVVPKDSIKEKKSVDNYQKGKLTVVGVKGEFFKDSLTLAGNFVSIPSTNGKQKPLIIINGVEAVGDNPLGIINPNRIESVTVLKDEQAVVIYGEKGKNGVLKIQLLPTDSVRSYVSTSKLQTVKLVSVPRTNSLSVRGVNMGNVDKTLVIVDGKEMLGDNALASIPADRIKSFTVLKDESAVATYGEKGKNGVVLVTMMTEEEYQYKKKTPQKRCNNALEIAMDFKQDYNSAQNMIIFIDGKESSMDEAEKLLSKDIRGVNTSEDKKKSTLNVYIISKKGTKSKE